MAQQAQLLQAVADPLVAEAGLMLVPSAFLESVLGVADALAQQIDSLRESPDRLRGFLDARGPLNGYAKFHDAALRGRVYVLRVLLGDRRDDNGVWQPHPELAADPTILSIDGTSAYQDGRDLQPARPRGGRHSAGRAGATPSGRLNRPTAGS